MKKDIHFLYDQTIEEREKLLGEIKELTNPKKFKQRQQAIILRKITLALIKAASHKNKPLKSLPKKPKKDKIIKVSKEMEKLEPKISKEYKPINIETNSTLERIENEPFHVEKVFLDTNTLKIYENLIDDLKDDIKKKKVTEVKQYIDEKTKQLARKYGVVYTSELSDNILKYFKSNVLSYGAIDNLIKDDKVKGIYCYGVNKPVEINLDDEKVKTDLAFKNNKEIDLIIKLLANKAKIEINEANPTLDVTFNNLKIHANLGNEYLESKFSIQKI